MKWTKKNIESINKAKEEHRKKNGLPMYAMDEDPDRFEVARNWAKRYIKMIKEEENNGYPLEWMWMDLYNDEVGTILRFWNFHSEKLDSEELTLYNWLTMRLN